MGFGNYMRLVLILLLLISTFSYAEEEIKYLKKSEVAPFTGYLSTPKQQVRYRQINEERKNCQAQKIKLEQLGQINDSNLEWYKENYKKLKSDYEWQQTSKFCTHTLYFLGGAAISSVIGYGAIRALRKD